MFATMEEMVKSTYLLNSIFYKSLQTIFPK